MDQYANVQLACVEVTLLRRLLVGGVRFAGVTVSVLLRTTEDDSSFGRWLLMVG